MQVTVTLTAVQTVDTETERTEQVAQGQYECTADGFRLQYTEPPQEDGTSAAVTVTVRGEQVVIERRGEMVSQLLLEEGKRHLCRYETPYGRLVLHTRTSRLAVTEWSIHAVYALEMQQAHTDHEIKIRIKEVSQC